MPTTKNGGLGAKVRGTVQASTKSASTKKNTSGTGSGPSSKTFGPGYSTPAGGFGKGKAPSAKTFSATAGMAVKDPGGKSKNWPGSNQSPTANKGKKGFKGTIN